MPTQEYSVPAQLCREQTFVDHIAPFGIFCINADIKYATIKNERDDPTAHRMNTYIGKVIETVIISMHLK